MRRPLIALLIILLGLCGLMLITGLVASSLVTGSGKHGVAAALQNSLGVPVSVGTARFDLEVDQFSVKSGEIAFLDKSTRPGENLDISGIDLQVRDYSRDHPFRVQLSAVLFHSNNSRLHLTGQAGPSTANSLPLEGTFSTTIAPGEIPPAPAAQPVRKVIGRAGKEGQSQPGGKHVSGSLGQLLTRVGASPSAGGADLPLVITGTVESLWVRPSVSKMVTNVAKGLLDSFLKKKTK